LNGFRLEKLWDLVLGELYRGAIMDKIIEENMKDKEQSEEFLRDVIMKYLEKLQGGLFGVPSTEELVNAGKLHIFLENM